VDVIMSVSHVIYANVCLCSLLTVFDSGFSSPARKLIRISGEVQVSK